MTVTIWLILLSVGLAGDLGIMAFDKLRASSRRVDADIARLRAADPAPETHPAVVRGRTQFDRHVDQAIEQSKQPIGEYDYGTTP